MDAPPPLNDLNAPSRFWLYLRIAMVGAAAMEVNKAGMYSKTKTAVRRVIKADLLVGTKEAELTFLTNLDPSLGDANAWWGFLSAAVELDRLCPPHALPLRPL
jgi:hypothetical protein